MPTDLERFEQYCKEGRLNEVKMLVEQADKTQHLPQIFSIDIPARYGQLEIVNYLFETQQVDIAPSNNYPGLLFNICFCQDKTKRNNLLNWLLENNRYKSLGQGISEAYLKAALGLPFRHLPAEAFGHLHPLHYACIVGNAELSHFSSDELNKPIENGYLKGATPLYLLCLNRHIDLLVKKGVAPKSLNTCPTDNGLQGVSLAFLLISYRRLDLLNKWSNEIEEAVDLNAGPTSPSHSNEGESVGLQLCLNRRMDLFSRFAQKNPKILQLGKTVAKGSNKGVNIAYALVCLGQFDLLNQLVKDSEGFIDLNTEYHGKKGMTLGWMLAVSSQKELFLHLSKNQKETLNLNKAPLSGPNKEISLASLLAELKILDQFAEETTQPVYLNALTMVGKTLLQYLIASSQFELIDTIIDTYLEQPNGGELLMDVFKKHSASDTSCIRLHLATRCYEKIKELLNEKEALGNQLNAALLRYIDPFIKHIQAISQNFPDYKEAQSLQGHLYLVLANAYEADNRINLQPLLAVDTLYSNALQAFMRGENSTMLDHLFMQQQATITALREENKEQQSTIATLRKRKEANMQQHLPTEQTSFSLPPFSFFDSIFQSAKRRRVEENETFENRP
ncbi:hypothetical protein [Legionella clemsonensis]|uniref:Uncharacterized protein n=1 Tax=Legionella clemsonensis TaxID=1867846 RepID=A0A222P3B0_9GAMM|nr:hypothetical protein [Legionella clemsonensis]ASQ46340.1 hypothetical protein clem_08945 [Legionella clemsonensis]